MCGPPDCDRFYVISKGSFRQHAHKHAHTHLLHKFTKLWGWLGVWFFHVWVREIQSERGDWPKLAGNTTTAWPYDIPWLREIVHYVCGHIGASTCGQGMDSQPAVEPDANYGGVTLSQLEEFLAVRKGCPVKNRRDEVGQLMNAYDSYKKSLCNVTRRVCRFADHSALLCVAMFSRGVSIALLGDRACPSDVDAVYRHVYQSHP